MAIVPRDYQIECVDSVWRYFEKNSGNPICALPTGTGKSLIIAMFLERALRAFFNQKFVCITHNENIITQNAKQLLRWWPGAPIGINSASLKQRDYNNKIIFGGIASVYKDAALFGNITMILIDEAHLVSPQQNTMYAKFIADAKQKNPFVKVIGFTATPFRTGQGYLTDNGIFTDFCFNITNMMSFNRLIEECYLSPLIPKKTNMLLDVSGVQMSNNGDYNLNELQAVVDKESITKLALEETVEYGKDRNHWLIFASGIEHCDHIAEMLNNHYGITCGVVHSKLKTNDQTLADFQNGKIQAVVNNNILTTGFDFPGIDLISCIRPTMSVILWIQLLGRGTRPLFADGYDLTSIDGRKNAMAASEKQNCLVLDFARNTENLGPINDPLIPKKKGQKKGEAPVKVCKSCDTFNHATVRFCTCCGSEFVFRVKIEDTASTAALIKADLPITKEFAVGHITFSRHKKIGSVDSVLVTYYCGNKQFKEFICVEHPDGSFAKRQADKWWIKRAKEKVKSSPESVTSALLLVEDLKTPTHIRVWTNKKYPEVIDVCFDGTCFSKQAEEDFDKEVTVTVLNTKNINFDPILNKKTNEEIIS